MNLRGAGEEFPMLKGEKGNTVLWNPLLVAISHKKLDVVQYFLGELKISLRQMGKRPIDDDILSDEIAAEAHTYCLQIAIATKDLLMLEELWGHYTAWDVLHLKKIIEIIIEERWGQGL
jgi:hypothetical protein